MQWKSVVFDKILIGGLQKCRRAKMSDALQSAIELQADTFQPPEVAVSFCDRLIFHNRWTKIWIQGRSPGLLTYNLISDSV